MCAIIFDFQALLLLSTTNLYHKKYRGYLDLLNEFINSNDTKGYMDTVMIHMATVSITNWRLLPE